VVHLHSAVVQLAPEESMNTIQMRTIAVFVDHPRMAVVHLVHMVSMSTVMATNASFVVQLHLALVPIAHSENMRDKFSMDRKNIWRQ